MPLTSGNMLANALSGRVSGAVRQGGDMARQRSPPQLTVGHAAKARPQAFAGVALPMATGSGIGSRCGQHCRLGAGREAALVSKDGAQIGQFGVASAQVGRCRMTGSVGALDCPVDEILLDGSLG